MSFSHWTGREGAREADEDGEGEKDAARRRRRRRDWLAVAVAGGVQIERPPESDHQIISIPKTP